MGRSLLQGVHDRLPSGQHLQARLLPHVMTELPSRKPRLPPRPSLIWKPDGTPVATDVDDVYFSVEDGLEETRAVFLAGCGLPERWQGRRQFTIAELGFGTGLNLLALWQMWAAHRPAPDARLDFISFEGFPLAREDAARALTRWPELAGFAEQLLAHWPVQTRGVQRIPLGDGVTLTLHLDDVASALPNSHFLADAWFLDGFAPARNEGMWAPELYPLIRARSEPGALVGTYTVAGAVRRGLGEAGFEVSKQPGFGRKRDRLQAIAPGEPVRSEDAYGLGKATADDQSEPRRVAVIGGGIAGVSAARAFAARGATVTLFDRAEVASGASGNKLALLMPRLDVGETAAARVLIAAYIAAYCAYRDLPGVVPVTVHQKPGDEADRVRYEKLLADPPLPEDWLGGDMVGGLLHKSALILDPVTLIGAMLDGIATRLGRTPEIDLKNRTVAGEVFDTIILANGMGLAGFPETDWLPLAGRLGQIETCESGVPETSAIVSGTYALASGRTRVWGATFMPVDGDAAMVSEAGRAENQSALEALLGQDLAESWLDGAEIKSRAGVRATTPDKLPIAGGVPDFARALDQFASVRNGAPPEGVPPLYEGVYMIGGLGARGFTFAPWLAELVAALAYGTALPTGQSEARLVSPMRFIFRDMKRKRI